LPIADARKKALSKSWKGSFTQGGKSYSINLHLKAKRKRIIGSGEYTDGSVQVKIAVQGGFYRDDHLHLGYRNTDKSIFQHGLFILHVPNDPKKLTGKFVGIGRDTNQIVGGDLTLES